MITWIKYYKYFSKLSDGKVRNIFEVAPNDPMNFLYHLEQYAQNRGINVKIEGNNFSISKSITAAK